MVERGDHMAAHLEHKHRQGQRRGQQRHTFKMRGFFNLAVRRGGRCGVRHRGGGVARGLRSLHNGGIRLCGKRLHHGLFPGEVDADIDHTRHGRQGAFDPPDAGRTGHVFNGIAPRLYGGGVACGRKCGDGVLGVETRCHLQRRRFRGEVHAGVLHTLHASKRGLDPPHARGAIHTANSKIYRNYIAHQPSPWGVLPLR